MKRLSACLISALSIFIMSASVLIGDWSGKLDIRPKGHLRLVLHVSVDSVTLDSPDQGAYGMVGHVNHLSDDSLSVSFLKLRARYDAALRDSVLQGTFRQGMTTMPLALKMNEEGPRRPQTPVPPFPYTTEEMSIAAPDAMLAGTLTLPANANKSTPLVVMVSGSGLQNRDEEIFSHKPFAVIADFLARNGVATFRYDDRGFGKSTGEVADATTSDFAADAKAVVDSLRSTGRFGKVGLLGHSEGAMIGYRLGAGADHPDFIIAVAGPAVKGTHTIGYQNKVALMKSGIPEEVADAFTDALERSFELKITAEEISEVSDSLLLEIYPEWRNDETTQRLGEMLRQSLTEPSRNAWMMEFLAYDPANDIRSLEVPTFIIYGEKDRQVPPSLNAEVAKRLAPGACIKVYPELNHLMQHAATGDFEEYGQIEETFAPEVLTDILTFIIELP